MKRKSATSKTILGLCLGNKITLIFKYKDQFLWLDHLYINSLKQSRMKERNKERK